MFPHRLTCGAAKGVSWHCFATCFGCSSGGRQPWRASVVVKHGSIFDALGILGVILLLATITHAISFACRRYGGDLGRKLTSPIGTEVTEPAELHELHAPIRIGHDSRERSGS